MPWSYDPRSRVVGGPAAGGAPDTRMQQLERRLTKLEQPIVSRAIATSDFTASEGETILIAGPSTGLRALLPEAKKTNHSARVTLVFTNSNPVTLRAVNGTVNGQALLSRNVVGAYTAISDGNGGWWIESLNPPRARQLEVQDFFLSGGTTSGTIGALGWNLGGVGTPAVTRGGVSIDGTAKLSLTTSGAANDRSSLTLNAETNTVATPEDVFLLQGLFDFNSDLTNKRVFFGFGDSMAVAPASQANNLGFLFDSGVSATNIYTIHRFGSSGTATDSGFAAASAAGQMFTIWQVTPKVYELRIGGTVVATIPQNLNVSTLPLNVGWRLETLTASAKTIRIGYFGMSSVTLGGPYDDDEFLKR